MDESGLSAKVALVTGVSRRIGIGAAIALELARAGVHVYITYYRPYDAAMPWGVEVDGAAEILALLRQQGVRAAGSEADLADPAAAQRLLSLAEESLGPVDILVNNAAHDVGADIFALTPQLLDAHYRVNLRAVALLCAEFARRYSARLPAARRGGRIINLTSGQALTPMPDTLPYVLTKGAVDALTLSLSAALAPYGVTVNAVDPGPTDTGWMEPALKARLAQQAPFGRVGAPQDVANLVRFLASTQGQWVTGQILRSRGGF